MEIILQIENKKMEDCVSKRVSIESKLKIVHSQIHHHASVQYGAAFFSKNPIARRGSNSQIVHWEKIKKQEIFELVYKFLLKLITHPTELNEILKDMKYEKEDKMISVSKINICSSENECSNHSVTSTEAFPQQRADKKTSSTQRPKKQVQMQKKKDRQAKVSIMVECLSDFSFNSGSKISCSSLVNISSIKFPPHLISIDMIREIFQQPQAFLINLALCLMIKFLSYSKIRIDNTNACWILSIATIVAYKIYYDDPVGGLIESFAQILSIKCCEIKDLERYFLDQINFQAVITSEQFHIMLARIVKP